MYVIPDSMDKGKNKYEENFKREISWKTDTFKAIMEVGRLYKEIEKSCNP